MIENDAFNTGWLQPHRLVEVLDWTTAALGHVNKVLKDDHVGGTLRFMFPGATNSGLNPDSSGVISV